MYEPVGPLLLARAERPLELCERLVERRLGRLAALRVAKEARALARVARGPSGSHERDQRVAVAVHSEFFERERVAGSLAFPPQLLPRAAPEMDLTGLAREAVCLLVHVGEGEDLAGARVLDDARDEPLRVVVNRLLFRRFRHRGILRAAQRVRIRLKMQEYLLEAREMQALSLGIHIPSSASASRFRRWCSSARGFGSARATPPTRRWPSAGRR